MKRFSQAVVSIAEYVGEVGRCDRFVYKSHHTKKLNFSGVDTRQVGILNNLTVSFKLPMCCEYFLYFLRCIPTRSRISHIVLVDSNQLDKAVRQVNAGGQQKYQEVACNNPNFLLGPIIGCFCGFKIGITAAIVCNSFH